MTPYVKSINAPDEKTIVFTLKKPAAYFPAILTTPTYAPANPANFPADKCVPLPPTPIYGTGPWYVSQYTVGEQVVFEPNPYYTGDLKPQVERIIVKRFADTQSLAQAIKNGTIDIVWQTVDGLVDVTLLNSVKTVSGLKISTINGGSLSFLVINHTMAPMDDPNVLTEGFAHGFVVTSDAAEFLYKTTDYYAPEHERSLLWNDPAIGIAWPLTAAPALSAKDAAGKRLADCDAFD